MDEKKKENSVRALVVVIALLIFGGSFSVWAVSTQEQASVGVGEVYEVDMEGNPELENILQPTTGDAGGIEEDKELFYFSSEEQQLRDTLQGTIYIYNSGEVDGDLNELMIELKAEGEDIEEQVLGTLTLTEGSLNFHISIEDGWDGSEITLSTTGNGSYIRKEGVEALDLEFMLQVDEVQERVTSQEVIVGPYFEVDITAPEEDETFFEGETVTVDYTVTNTGVGEDTQDIEFYVDGELVDTEEDITLGEDEVHDDEFTWTAEEPYGERDLSVHSEDDDDEVTIIVMEVEETFFEVTIDQPEEGDEFDEGETITVDYTVTNIGEEEDTQDIEFYVDGELIEVEEEVTLGEDEVHDDEFTWTAEEPYGERVLLVESEDDDDEVTIMVIEVDEGFFEVTITDTNDPIREEEDLIVDVEVENTGNQQGTQDIVLRDFDDEVVDTEEDLTIEAGITETITLTWETEEGDGGRDDITVESDDDSDSETVIITRMTINDELGEYEGDPAEWQTHWEATDVDVEGLDEIELLYDFLLEGDDHPNRPAEARVRILINGDAEMSETTFEEVEDTYNEFIDVSDYDEIDIEFQVYTEEGQRESEVTIYEAGYEHVPSDGNPEMTVEPHSENHLSDDNLMHIKNFRNGYNMDFSVKEYVFGEFSIEALSCASL